MWGKPPFVISDNCTLDVHDLKIAREWYKEKLGLQDSRNRREDDSGRPFADLIVPGDETLLSLIESAPGARDEKPHVIFFAKNLEKTYQWRIVECSSSRSLRIPAETACFGFAI